MQKIQSLELPEQLPLSRALKSCEQNQHDYESEFWEFRYDIWVRLFWNEGELTENQ
jgi:hypothetical protein